LLLTALESFPESQTAIGRLSILTAHIVKEKIHSIEHGSKILLTNARLIGPQFSRWSEVALKEHEIHGMRIAQWLLSLTRTYECSAIEELPAKSHNAVHASGAVL
jgi:hypothetical protein